MEKRNLVFTDSLVSMRVLAKGTSSVAGLIHLARQAAAALLARGVRLAFLWVALEDYVADVWSRGLGTGEAEATEEEHK